MSEIYSTDSLQGNIIDTCYVVSIYDNIEDEQLKKLCDYTLDVVYNKRINGVVLDLTNMRIVDTYAIELLINTTNVISLLGSMVMWTGLQAGTVSSILDLDLDISKVQVGVNVQSCISKINLTMKRVIK